MRTAFCFVGVCLLLFPGPAAAQSSSSGTSRSAPTEIAGKTLEQWIKDISHRDPSIRENAIRTVPYFGKRARDAAPALTRALADKDGTCRVHAALALMAIREYLNADETAAAVDGLCQRLNSDVQGIVRFHAAYALSAFGSDARPAIPSLINQMKDQASHEIRRAAVIALSNAARDHKNGPDARAVNAIAGIFFSGTEPSRQVRLQAAMALGDMGRPGQPELNRAIQALHRARTDPDKSVAIWAEVSLMALTEVNDKGLDAIAKHLKGTDVNAKAHAAQALVAMGREARPKVPDLMELLDDKDLYTVAVGIAALGELKGYANAAVPKLTEIMKGFSRSEKEQNEYIRGLAKEAIDSINGNNAEVKPK